MAGKTMTKGDRVKDKLLMIGFCGAWLVACGGDGGGGKDGSSAGSISFQDLCDLAAKKICDEINVCDSPVSKPDCIAQIKAANCPSGPEQYCGATGTYQASKAPACLDAINASGCELLESQPAECSPEVMCSSSSGGGSTTAPPSGAACKVLESTYECDPKASLCYAAGSSSSCAGEALCVGDINGLFCAARCTVDADCATTGTGLVCLQGCKVSILNGFCVTTQAKAKFLQRACTNGSESAAGVAGWSL